MLFMGSRKFPRHNEYSEFISLNSGMDNAWTSDEETNYYFEIANGKFLEGVERLSDFFVEAMLTETCIEKERQAVHEECQLRCGEDNSRKWEILKHFASGPYHNHSIGNNETLSHPLVGQDLREFYKREYSGNRINAVLLSALPIEEMKARAIPFFLEVADKQLPKIEYELHFQPANIGKMVRMKSIKDESIMEFFWIVDPLRPHYRHHPEKYLTHILGHEGKHSLLSILKEHEYASKISSYSHDMPRQSIIGLEIQLTEHGEEEYEKVYNLVIDYCAWLKADARIYNEIK
jgi:insulysin